MRRLRHQRHHAPMPRYRRYHEPGYPVFVTLVTAHRRRWLGGDRDKRHLIECLRETKSNHHFRHYAHVILDDHMHWLFKPEGGNTFSDIVTAFKSSVVHGRRRLGWPTRKLWQKRFYDHLIRNENDFRQHMDYIHYNPVRHGYVRIARQWRWSSFHTWLGRGNYTHCWGTKEPDGPTQAGEPKE